MNRLEIRGVIVPSDYDLEWAQKYVDRGIITPESSFRRNLAQADKSQPLSVYVNSPGGSVFAANEMINAVREWKMESKQPVNVTVGAMAASAASAFAIMAGDTISAHRNAKMMFHGAWTVSVGGKEMHQDTAELLGMINADIKTRLVSKYKLAPETVNEWFAEGREGWLSAGDMQTAGIAQSVIDDDAGDLDRDADALMDIEQRGIGIAAFYAPAKIEVQNASDAVVQSPAVSGAGTPDSQEPAVVENAEHPERIAGRAEGFAEGAEQRAEEAARASAKIASLEQLTKQLQSEKDKALAAAKAAQDRYEASLKEMSDKLTAATERLTKFLDGGLKFSAAPSTWQEALAACDGDYVKAAKAYPELRQKFNSQKTK